MMDGHEYRKRVVTAVAWILVNQIRVDTETELIEKLLTTQYDLHDVR